MNQLADRSANHKRQCSRRLALQALYQWQFTQDPPADLTQQYKEDEYWPKSDHDYFITLVSGSVKQVEELDEHINDASEYTIKQIDPIELAALRMAVYELCYCLQVPEKVVIAEAIRLCKKFGSNEGFKLVNAILDRLAKKIDRKEQL